MGLSYQDTTDIEKGANTFPGRLFVVIHPSGCPFGISAINKGFDEKSVGRPMQSARTLLLTFGPGQTIADRPPYAAPTMSSAPISKVGAAVSTATAHTHI